LLARGLAAAIAFSYLAKSVLLPGRSGPKLKTYGNWRTDVPAEPGYSRELICPGSWELVEGGKTTLEELRAEPYPGVDTVFKAM
jgi:hypothetical protein